MKALPIGWNIWRNKQMSCDASDIDIFVLTYNRADLLPSTLRSLLAQSVRGASITVLDNASIDATEIAVQPFFKFGVRYERAASNLGWAGNLSRAQAMARRAWTLIFHDDDLLHPRYLEYALKAINGSSRLSLLASAMSFETAPKEDDWASTAPEVTVCEGAGDLAALMYSGFPLHFGSAIYRTDVLRTLKWEGDIYGKIADRPFLLTAADQQVAVVFRSPLIRYRMHASQDSMTSENGPFALQLAALHCCFHRYTGENPLSSRGRIFLWHNYRAICDEFPRLSRIDKERFPSLSDYLDFVVAAGGGSRFSLMIGRMAAIWGTLRHRLSV